MTARTATNSKPESIPLTVSGAFHAAEQSRSDENVEKSRCPKVILADKLGFDIAYIGEHFSCTTEQIASPLIFFASLINQTKNIKFATGVMGLPQYHPVIVAAEVAMLDQMSKGRFVFGIGPGGLASDLEVFEHEDHGWCQTNANWSQFPGNGNL